MTVVVRNELSVPWVFEASRGSRQLAPGQVAVISDEEWASIITAKRGPGGMHAVSNDPGSRIKTKFDYADVGGGDFEVVYLGQADQGAQDADHVWSIKKFSYSSISGANQITSVEILDSVAWADRATLPWT